MEHAASPSLISFGLTADTSSNKPSLPLGLIFSCALHVLVIVMAMLIRFQPEIEEPFRTIEVSLISLPPAASSSTQPTPAKPKKTAKVAPPPKIASPPKPTPVPIPKTMESTPPPKAVIPQAAPQVEETLPPLPTNTASERLSESLGGAINSILVPQKRQIQSSTVPVQEPALPSSENQPPLLDNLRLPSAPPTIARPKRLQPAEPLKHSPSMINPPTQGPQETPAPLVEPTPSTQDPVETIQPAIKPAPAIPSLREATPFTKSKQTSLPSQTPKSPNIEESLKRQLPDIPNAPQMHTRPKINRKRIPQKPNRKLSTPQISAPQMAKIPKATQPTTSTQAPAIPNQPIPDPKISSKPIPDPTIPSKPISTPPKISDTVKKLMERLKTTKRKPSLEKNPLKPKTPSPATITPPIAPPPSAIDQQIAKLSIPEVTPVESIKQRLKLLEVQASESSGGSTSKPSEGKNRYLAMVEKRIDQNWIAPPLLGSNPVVILAFHIARSGEISGIHIIESSGHAHYDSAAQRAVQAVNPLPSFSNDIPDLFFDVKYRFIKD